MKSGHLAPNALTVSSLAASKSPSQGPGGASLMPLAVILLLLTAQLLLVYVNGFHPPFTHQQQTLGWEAYHVCDLLV